MIADGFMDALRLLTEYPKTEYIDLLTTLVSINLKTLLMFTLLHLSDLHFGNDHFFSQYETRQQNASLAIAIKRALSKTKVDHVVLTGDFFSKEFAKDQLHALAGIRQLREQLGLDADQLSFVPGNHDLSWDPDFQHDRFVAYDKLMIDLGCPHLATTGLPVVIHINKTHGGHPILLALINSCTVESKELAGIGNIGETQLELLKNKIDDATEIVGPHTLLVALHHHLLPIYPIEKLEDPNWPTEAPKGRSSHTLDAVDVLNQMASLKASLIIHGHQHKVGFISYRDILRNDTPLNIAAAGSCGSKHDERQFYLYEIATHDIKVRSFYQGRSDSRFILDNSINFSIQIRNAEVDFDGFCDEEVKYVRAVQVRTDEGEHGPSDLHLLFLSVRDCQAARIVVREFVESTDVNPACKLDGMYDLSGRWDLLVRLQVDSSVNFRKYETQLRERLYGARQMERSGPDFSDHQHVDVDKEARTAAGVLDSSPGTRGLKRRILRDTNMYEDTRCQRAFLYIKMPDKPHRKDGLVHALSTCLDSNEVFRNIVEGIYRGEHALVIEVFMSCAQSQGLNHLNRRVEPVLTEYGVQKYTMQCYGYDEVDLSGAMLVL